VDNKKVLYELERIASIENLNAQLSFEFESAEDLKILNHYLDTGKTVDFEDLFDIELILDVKGQMKRVDLKEQVESDGTDRMIRLVIVMSIINRLAISSEDNKIVLFIDEIGTIDEHNRPQLVQFCRDHHFIPIFAAPQPYDGFSKYYFIFRSKGKINLNDKAARCETRRVETWKRRIKRRRKRIINRPSRPLKKRRPVIRSPFFFPFFRYASYAIPYTWTDFQIVMSEARLSSHHQFSKNHLFDLLHFYSNLHVHSGSKWTRDIDYPFKL
jgi:hypothetical protein